jgi:hypothetical protein
MSIVNSLKMQKKNIIKDRIPSKKYSLDSPPSKKKKPRQVEFFFSQENISINVIGYCFILSEE